MSPRRGELRQACAQPVQHRVQRQLEGAVCRGERGRRRRVLVTVLHRGGEVRGGVAQGAGVEDVRGESATGMTAMTAISGMLRE